MSLSAYITNSPSEVKNAYLKMVPYWVTKKPSEPSLMTSAMSCIPLGPTSFFKISHSIIKAIHINTMLVINAENEIMLDVEVDTNM